MPTENAGYVLTSMTVHDHDSQPGDDGQHRPSQKPDVHRASVVAAEVARLERPLRAIGPMHRDRLAEACGAHRWREGTFEEAIREGVRLGRLRRLPLGWIEASDGASDSQTG